MSKSQVTVENKPCTECNRSAEEEGMIGCHNTNPECNNWLHYSCDAEVNNEETADKIKKYYCPPCRKLGEEMSFQRAASINQKYKISTLNEEPHSTEEISPNEESDIEYGEDALTSPTITPNQPPPNQSQREASDHELSQLIESVPDHFNNEWKMKDIVEKIKRVSISNEQEEEKSPTKLQKKKKKTLKKAMQHRKKGDILNEYDKLNEKAEKLKEEKETAENKVIQLENLLATEQKYREKMENLEKELKTKDNNSLERKIYEAEMHKQTQERKIKSLLEKIDEHKKKNAEKQNEIKELKTENEQKLSELTAVKTAFEKETDLRTKAESILHLTEEKLEAQILLYEEEKEKSLEKAKNIQKLEEKINQQTEAEKSTIPLKKPESGIKMINITTQTEKNTPTNPNVIEDNKEMVKIIEKLEEENHELSVQVVRANIEIDIRKKLVDELNENYNHQIEKLSKSYVEKCLQLQKNAEEKLKNIQNREKCNEADKTEIENLKTNLREKSQEAENLKNELEKIAENKYETIKKKTEPLSRQQGIPNTYTNGCFIIAPIHALAECIDPKVIEKEDNSIAEHIMEVKECLKGNKNEEEAETVMKDIWEFSTTKWPQYRENNGIAIQEDATEYLDRILTNSNALKNETELVYTQETKCTNKDCEILSTVQRRKSNTNPTSSTNGKEKILLQDLVENHFLKSEETCNYCHQNTKITKRVERAPPTLILTVPRHTEEGVKINTKIGHNMKSITMYENEEHVEYGVSGVIIHRGSQGLNGHYIYNHFDPRTSSWKQIDDHLIRTGSEVAGENKQGVIFILTKLDRKRNQKTHKAEEKLPNRNRPEHFEERNPRYRTTPCKFYKYDQCTKGENCTFLHHTCSNFIQGNCPYNDYCKFKHPTPEINKPKRSTHYQY